MTLDKKKRMLAAALTFGSFAFGLISGFAVKDLCDQQGAVHASEAKSVPVHRMSDPLSISNTLIGPDLWRVYVDPLFIPVDLPASAFAPLVPLSLPTLLTPPIDVPHIKTIDGEKDLQVVAQVPGLSDKDIDVEVGKEMLTIKGHKKEETADKNKHFSSVEESFVRTVRLPCNVDGNKVQATVKDGVLTVSLPKNVHSPAKVAQ